jgi:hypothetical protein
VWSVEDRVIRLSMRIKGMVMESWRRQWGGNPRRRRLTPSGFSSIWYAVIAGPMTAKWGYTDSEFSAYVLAPATTASTM